MKSRTIVPTKPEIAPLTLPAAMIRPAYEIKNMADRVSGDDGDNNSPQSRASGADSENLNRRQENKLSLLRQWLPEVSEPALALFGLSTRLHETEIQSCGVRQVSRRDDERDERIFRINMPCLAV
jgi:hypothetical protein